MYRNTEMYLPVILVTLGIAAIIQIWLIPKIKKSGVYTRAKAKRMWIALVIGNWLISILYLMGYIGGSYPVIEPAIVAASIAIFGLVEGISMSIPTMLLFYSKLVHRAIPQNTAEEQAYTAPAANTPGPAVPPADSADPAAIDQAFFAIVQRISAERGAGVLENVRLCRGLLQDYAGGGYKKESRLFLQALEAGCAVEILRDQDPDITRPRLIHKLHEDFYINREAAEAVVHLLYTLINNSKGGQG